QAHCPPREAQPRCLRRRCRRRPAPRGLRSWCPELDADRCVQHPGGDPCRSAEGDDPMRIGGSAWRQTISTGYVTEIAKEGRSSAVGLYVTSFYAGGSMGAFLPGLAWLLGRMASNDR